MWNTVLPKRRQPVLGIRYGKKVTDEEGEEVIYCFIGDISEKKERELQAQFAGREAARQARFLTQLYNSIPCGILQFEPEPPHHIVNFNRRVWEFYGYHSEEDYMKELYNPLLMALEHDRDKIESKIRSLRVGSGIITYTRESRKMTVRLCGQCDHGTPYQCGWS